MDFKKVLRKFGFNSPKSARNRIKVRAVHGVHFELDNLALPIVNLSQSGIGVLAHPSRELNVGEKINGKIQIAGASCDLTVEVIHITGQLVGCHILNSDGDYQNFLKQYFESELEGIKLQPIDRSKLSPDENGEPYWFFSDSNHEIYFTVKKQKVTSLQITYQNYVVVIDPKDQISTGIIWTEELDKEIEHKTSDLVKGPGSLPEDIKQHIVRFAGAKSDIPKDIRVQIEKKLTQKLFKN